MVRLHLPKTFFFNFLHRIYENGIYAAASLGGSAECAAPEGHSGEVGGEVGAFTRSFRTTQTIKTICLCVFLESQTKIAIEILCLFVFVIVVGRC